MKTSLMLKLSSIAILSSSLLLGASNDKKVLDYLKGSIASNKGFTVKNISIKNAIDIKKVPKWKAYFINIELHVKKDNKDVNVSDIIFSNGSVMTKDLMDMDEKKSLKNTISLPLDPKLYNKKHLIAGNTDAKNRLVVFSDPVCPFCIDYVPDVIEAVKKYPKEFALYYYHLPLPMHKSAMGFSKAMLVAEKLGKKDVTLQTYKSDFSSKIASESEILKAFNKAFGTKITEKQINQKWVTKEVEADMKEARELMVNGTPTVFVNGEKDMSRKLFQGLLDKIKSKK